MIPSSFTMLENIYRVYFMSIVATRIKFYYETDGVVHTCNPSIQESEAGRS
jgi:hypothetical protein